jgi:hypothetical protein
VRQSGLGWIAVAAAAVAFFLVLSSGMASATEVNYQNPVTAAPPLNVPPTAHCTVSLANHAAFGPSGYDVPVTGTFSPPAGCPGPWSMVVLEFTGRVQGVQFDRETEIWVGNVLIYYGTTPEPDPQGITWTVTKDVTEYTSVFEQAQPYAIHLPNVVNSQYTGIEYVTASLTFYVATPAHPAPSGIPNVVLPLTADANWAFDPGGSLVGMAPFVLPRNAVSLNLELWAKGNSCDEFWYASEPTSYASAHGLCPGGAFREVLVYIDGTLAGSVFPFPYIFTGGINPLLWRPIPAVDAFDEPAYYVDLTPFVGELVDGQPHTLSLQVVNNGFYWQLGGNLLVDVEAGASQTTGALTTDTMAPGAQNSTTQTVGSRAATFDFLASRSYTIAGYVDTSLGRVTTTVSSSLSFSSHQVLNLVSFTENVNGNERARTTITVATPTTTTATTTTDSYPITVVSAFVIPEGAFNPNANLSTERFLLPASVTQAWNRTVTESVNGALVFDSRLSDSVGASATLSESFSGQVLSATGSDSETYLYSDTSGICFHHALRASQGYVTSNTYFSGC